MRDDVLIVGGGVIGLASALALLEAGRSVRVLEQAAVGSGSSHGNCGTITPSHAAPMAAPGTVAKALRWMLTPDAPFYVRPRLDPRLWRWMLEFAARCNPGDWRAAMVARSALLETSRRTLPEWLSRHAIDCEFMASGVDYVFRSDAALARFVAELPALEQLGIQSQRIDARDYLRDEPALRDGLVGVVRFPGDARLRPDRYVAGLASAVTAAGGVIEEGCEVRGLREAADGVEAESSLGARTARDVLIATGAWSPLLAKSAGLGTLPIQPGKGYSITYARPPVVPSHPLVLWERSVCVTAWDSGFRLGSTMEFSGYDRTLNRRRLAAIERGADEYLHHPEAMTRGEEWFGWRPVTVDDVPIIGRVPGRRHLWLATGHGMLGVSMSTGTAMLVTDLLCGAEPHIDPTPFAPERFS